jgi:predicted ATP-grasp superfamily ATP-dependent carboligase
VIRRVLVTDAGRSSAIAIMRSLGRRGWHVVAADADRGSPGFRSRYVGERLCHPDPAVDPSGAAAAVLEAAERSAVDLIVPVTDELVLPLAAARDRLPAGCVLAVADDEGLAATGDKVATLELAQRIGVPTPPTAVVRTVDEALEAAPGLGWPVVVKPAVSRLRTEAGIERFTVAYANDATELADRMQAVGGRTAVLLQGYVPGEGHGVELLMAGGRPLAAFQHHRLREVPITGGASSFRESVELDPGLLDASVRLLGALSWTGLAMVEFRVGAGGPSLMEVNGRIWGSLPLAVKAGMDFPARMADLFLDGPTPEGPVDTDYRIGVRSRNVALDVVWIGSTLRRRRRYPYLESPRRRDALAAAAGLLRPGDGYDLLEADDPGPALAELRGLAGKLRSKVADA